MRALPVLAHEPDAEEIALGSLVDAEFAFARMGLAQGIRASFLANFADDGIVLQPAPLRLRDAWNEQPAPDDPLALRLEWKPAQAGVARSRDMGYTTGPSALSRATNPQKVRHGVFFSVWQRNAVGRWQVALDVGITAPEAVNFVPLGAAPRPAFRGRANPQQERKGLLAREANAFSAGAAGLTPSAYAQLLAPDVRLHRDGIAPLASRGEVAKEVARRIARVTWAPIDARVAASADLAVTYGRYREIDHAQKPSDGYYAHLWLRDAAGRWGLAYDIALAAPE